MKKRPTVKGVGKRLAEIRKQRGLSQRALATLIGTSGRMIAYYESETAYPPTHLVDPICKALKISADEFLGLKPYKQDIASEELPVWRRFKKVQTLSVRGQKTVFSLIHALASKKEVRTSLQLNKQK